LVWVAGRAPSARQATTGREGACRTGRVGSTAWASGFDQNKSPFSRLARRRGSVLQCLMLLLRGTRSGELSIWSDSLFPCQTLCLSGSNKRWMARESNTQAFARPRPFVSVLPYHRSANCQTSYANRLPDLSLFTSLLESCPAQLHCGHADGMPSTVVEFLHENTNGLSVCQQSCHPS
jgi:hypothetical protein